MKHTLQRYRNQQISGMFTISFDFLLVSFFLYHHITMHFHAFLFCKVGVSPFLTRLTTSSTGIVYCVHQNTIYSSNCIKNDLAHTRSVKCIPFSVRQNTQTEQSVLRENTRVPSTEIIETVLFSFAPCHIIKMFRYFRMIVIAVDCNEIFVKYGLLRQVRGTTSTEHHNIYHIFILNNIVRMQTLTFDIFLIFFFLKRCKPAPYQDCLKHASHLPFPNFRILLFLL